MGRRRAGSIAAARRWFAAGLIFALMQAAGGARAWGQGAAGSSATTWTVTIVLPPLLVAGQAATLAVLGTDGKLARGVEVEIGPDIRVHTDPIGRAYFTVPAGGKYVIAKSDGSSAAALVDAAAPAAPTKTIAIAQQVSREDSFSICGGGFSGDAEANRVELGGEPALVLAASPECLVVLAAPKTAPGTAAVTVKTARAEWTGETTLVSLRYEPPQPPLVAQKKSRLAVIADGTAQPLRIRIQNESPGVLQYLRGDKQELRTNGGTPNEASFEVEAVSSGDYSFHAWIIPPADTVEAGRYLDAAIPLAGENLGKELKKLSGRLKRHPRDPDKVAAQLDGILNVVITGELRTLLAAARNCL